MQCSVTYDATLCVISKPSFIKRAVLILFLSEVSHSTGECWQGLTLICLGRPLLSGSSISGLVEISYVGVYIDTSACVL